MKQFANLSTQSLANLLGLKLEGRKGIIVKNESATHYLSAQIRLYVLLHFFANSNDGSIEFLPLKMLTSQTETNEKTILRSLSLLHANGFISAPAFSEDKEVSLHLLNLTDMYKRRGEGGQGYLTCNQDLLHKILAAKSINSLRVIITGLLKATIEELNRAVKSIGRIRITINEFKKSFPKSSRPVDIRKASSAAEFDAMFDRVEPDQPKSIIVRLKEELNGKFIKSQIRIDAKNKLQQEIRSLNEIIDETNATIQKVGHVSIANIRGFNKHAIDLTSYVSIHDRKAPLPLLDMNSAVRNDCATIAQDYGTDSVLHAIHIFYTDYLLAGTFKPDKKKSLGGLIRSIVEDLIQSNTFDPSLV